MSESIPALQKAIRDLHGCGSTFVEDVPVVERMHVQASGESLLKSGWRTVWEGVVYVFDLIDHGSALRAYAWSAEGTGGKRRYTAVLHSGKVDSPEKAVRAAIIAEHRRAKQD